jgi:penicillin-binding protein 2
MKELRRYAHEIYTFQSRIRLIGWFVLLAFIILVVRFSWLQIIKYSTFNEQAENNRVSITPIVPNRGVITDRYGTVLAHNYSGYTLEIEPRKVSNLDATIEDLSKIISISVSDRKRFDNLLKETHSLGSIPIRRLLKDEEVARFIAQRYRFPGVDVQARLFRQYPFIESASHIVGHIGRISEVDRQRLEETEVKENYLGSEYIGKAGIEKTYEDFLHGTTGSEEAETTSWGATVRLLGRKPSTPGHTVTLSIDMNLQQLVEKELGDRRGALVAIDPNNGEVLAMVSTPGFNPNLFVDGIDSANWKLLNESPNKPLLNRTIQGGYSPGSTYKPYMSLAGLALGVRDEKYILQDPGFFVLGNHTFKDDAAHGHGAVDLHKAIVMSCDTYYYSLANQIGVNAMHDFMGQFGFGSKTMVDLENEQAGILPSTQWKEARFKQKWHAGETISLGIGQGYNTFTPMQMAVAVSAIANKGIIYKPRLVKQITNVVTQEQIKLQPEIRRKLNIDSRYFDLVHQAMIDVNKSGTSARAFAGAAYTAAGKTGTTQVFSLKKNQKYNHHALDEYLRDHALFIAYAPAESPKIALAIIVENAGFGAVSAAPIARKALDYYLVDREKNLKNGWNGHTNPSTTKTTASTSLPVTE